MISNSQEFGFDPSQESFEQPLAKVADGVWSVCTKHNTGLLSFSPTVNNRGYVFRLNDPENGDFLLLFGVPGGDALGPIRQVIDETGLKLEFVVSSGDSHHMFLRSYIEAFPEARILMSGLKFPTTRNGKELLAEFPDRIELHTDTKIKALEPYRSQIDFVCFTEYLVYNDEEFMSKNGNSPSTKSMFGFMFLMAFAKWTQRNMMIWAYHVPTKTITAEHNYTMFFTAEEKKQWSSWLFRSFLPTEIFASVVNHNPFLKIADPRKNSEAWKQMLQLDIRCIVDMHTAPGTVIKRFPDETGCRDMFISNLAESGEDDPTGESLVYNKPSRCTIL